jgi:hypothetical protein
VNETQPIKQVGARLLQRQQYRPSHFQLSSRLISEGRPISLDRSAGDCPVIGGVLPGFGPGGKPGPFLFSSLGSWEEPGARARCDIGRPVPPADSLTRASWPRYAHSGFSWSIRRMISRSSRLTRGLPGRPLDLQLHRSQTPLNATAGSKQPPRYMTVEWDLARESPASLRNVRRSACLN